MDSKSSRRRDTRDTVPKMVDGGFNKQKGELDMLQEQLKSMEDKMGGSGTDMSKMMD